MDIEKLEGLKTLAAQVVSGIESMPFPRVENNKEGVQVGMQLNQLLGKALTVFKELEKEVNAKQIPEPTGTNEDVQA